MWGDGGEVPNGKEGGERESDGGEELEGKWAMRTALLFFPCLASAMQALPCHLHERSHEPSMGATTIVSSHLAILPLLAPVRKGCTLLGGLCKLRSNAKPVCSRDRRRKKS
jgi:hypothetical protein